MFTKNASARKSPPQFTETLYGKQNTDVFRFGGYKGKRNAIQKVNVLWLNIAKFRGHTKINQKVR